MKERVISKLGRARVIAGAVLLCLMIFGTGQIAHAASDKKKPTLSVKSVTMENTKETGVKVKASDASGISVVKYADSYQKTSYFKKNGIEVSLTNGEATVMPVQNGTYTFYAQDKAGNTKIKRITVEQNDTTAPVVELSVQVMNQTATVSISTVDLESGVVKVMYVKGEAEANSEVWNEAVDITGQNCFETDESGIYTVKAIDEAGNETVDTIKVNLELKAVWISYLEFLERKCYTEDTFTTAVDDMFDKAVELNMNAVIVQVRMFSDAMYNSKYFPWSQYASGTQGVDPGFDPMQIMIDAAHERGLEFHAWLNPYRITTKGTDVSSFADDNPAKRWLTDDDTSNDRNVLTFNGALYYNPASSQVRKLIVNGVKEIVQNYDVDGIHFDDYFYPSLGSNYAKLFDCDEYNTYVDTQNAAGKTVKTIADWRRGNVNTLIKSVYSAIKELNPKVRFGVSPAGNISNLTSNEKYYVDVATWLSKDGYIDYICPQLYWTFEHSSCPFDKLLNQWIQLRTNENVSIYAGIANYRAGSDIEKQWMEDSILADMVEYGRSTGVVDGYMFFRYDFFFKKVCLPAVNELVPVLGE